MERHDRNYSVEFINLLVDKIERYYRVLILPSFLVDSILNYIRMTSNMDYIDKHCKCCERHLCCKCNKVVEYFV